MKKIFQLAAILIITSVNVFCLDKVKMADHLKKALSLDNRIEIKVMESTNSSFGNLMAVPVTVGGAPYTVYMTKDEKQYFWGFVVDYLKDPDLDRMAQMKPEIGYSQGNPKAKVTVVEYSDLQCPYCSKTHELLKKELFAKYKPEEVRLIFKHFPLAMHDWAEKAALATDCAYQQKPELFNLLMDLVFKNQGTINKDNVTQKINEYAKSSGVDVDKLNVCMASPAALKRIQDSKAEGNAVGVTSTPTLVINGRLRRGIRDFEDIKVVIDEKLNTKK
ncbi:MAG: DsbA family protein [Elusimicrobiota bacterium]